MKPYPLTPDEKRLAKQLKRKGFSQLKIADCLNRPQSIISGLFNLTTK